MQAASFAIRCHTITIDIATNRACIQTKGLHIGGCGEIIRAGETMRKT